MSKVDLNTPNTKARVAARRAARRKQTRRSEGSKVHPGTRRLLSTWLATGQLFSAVVFMVCIGVLYHLFTAPTYTIERVDVYGNAALSDEAIAQLTGLRGVPIWFADTVAANERLLASAYVEQASVNVFLPGTAVVRVIERQPDMRWQVGGVQYLVDATGKVLDAATTPPDEGTLVIVDRGVGSLQANDQVDPDALELARLLSLRLPQELNLVPSQIGWDIALGVYITTASDQTIVFGQTDNLDRKLLILNRLLSEQTAFSYLDLRPSNPFFRNNTQATETVEQP
jgi:cell division protein FtsQ